MAEKALIAEIQKGWIQGNSTRSIDYLVKAMRMNGIFRSKAARGADNLT